jgi:hypothetical protein
LKGGTHLTFDANGGADLKAGSVLQQELTNFPFAQLFRGTHEQGNELACIVQVITSRGGAEVAQPEIFRYAITETTHR